MGDSHKYDIGETVHVGWDGFFGIVEDLTITTKQFISRMETRADTDIIYNVQVGFWSFQTFGEGSLSPSKRKLHPEAFKPRAGQVISIEGREYLIEEFNRIDYMNKLSVKARELSDGRYNPQKRVKDFFYDLNQPLDIVRVMERVVDFR